MINLSRLKKCYNNAKALDVQLDVQTIVHSRILQELEDSRFCPQSMISFFKECDKYIVMRLGTVTYHIYYKKSLTAAGSAMIKSIQRTHALMEYCNIQKPINVHIIMAPYKRYFPTVPSEIIDTIHINGGFTTSSSNDIFIIRSEEASKVILHEVLHHCKFVHNNNWTAHQLDRLYTAFNISKSTSLYPNEAMVELWATMMHCMFIVLDYGLPLNMILDTEVHYSLQQCRRILRMQNGLSGGKWREHTNAYCYIIFKTILLMNIKVLAHTYPYDPEYITQFLIDHKSDIDDTRRLKEKKWCNASLRMMKSSDM